MLHIGHIYLNLRAHTQPDLGASSKDNVLFLLRNDCVFRLLYYI